MGEFLKPIDLMISSKKPLRNLSLIYDKYETSHQIQHKSRNPEEIKHTPLLTHSQVIKIPWRVSH